MGLITEFGRARRADFLLAEGIDHLNHGGFGATPRSVLAAAERWRARMEADPSTFFRSELPTLLRAAADRVAGCFGGRGADWAFVENATSGLNAIVASLDLRPDDELICLSQTYNAVANALRYHAGRIGARVVTVHVPVPLTDPEPLLGGLRAALTRRTRLAVFDHVTSAGAAILPIGDMAAICRAAGVPVAIDGAHALGMLPVDAPALGVDWYVGNLHKWAFAAKGTAVLWCAPQHRARTHPLAISHFLGQGFPAEFDYAGTRDNSGWLAAPAALDYLTALGPAAQDRNRELALAAADMLSRAWRSEAAAGPALTGTMASIRLPGWGNSDRDTARRLAARLVEEHGITAGVMVLENELWLRVSAQVYNELADYERFARLIPSLGARP